MMIKNKIYNVDEAADYVCKNTGDLAYNFTFNYGMADLRNYKVHNAIIAELIGIPILTANTKEFYGH